MVCSSAFCRKLRTLLTVTEKRKSSYDEIKITYKCAAYDGWLQNFKQHRVNGRMDVCGEVLSADVKAA